MILEQFVPDLIAGHFQAGLRVRTAAGAVLSFAGSTRSEPDRERPAWLLCAWASDCHEQFLHHTCTTTEWHSRYQTVSNGHSESSIELLKYTFVLLAVARLPTFAS